MQEFGESMKSIKVANQKKIGNQKKVENQKSRK